MYKTEPQGKRWSISLCNCSQDTIHLHGMEIAIRRQISARRAREPPRHLVGFLNVLILSRSH